MTINRSLNLISLTLLLALFSSFALAETIYVVNSQSRTLSRIDSISDVVNNQFATLGNVPNKIVVDNSYIWSVNSGDNAVQKIDRITGTSLANIFLGAGVNPWDACRHEDKLYVTGLFSGKVYRVDATLGIVSGNVSVGTAPEALQVIGNKLYVSNAGNYAQNYVGSSISVIDLDSFTVLHTIPVPANPQYLASYNGMLHVSCTGNWADIGGAICIIDPDSNSVVHTIELGGTPGRIWIANPNLALVADSNGMHLFSYDPQSYEILHGASNPLPGGGSEVDGNADFIAVLVPNWSGNGEVKLLHNDLNVWKQYTVAMMPTDLKLGHDPVANDDLVLQVPSIKAYPNPVQRDAKLSFASDQQLSGVIRIYNLKGQQLASQDMGGKDISLKDLDLRAGLYFYHFYEAGHNKAVYTGKFLVVN